MSQSKSSNFRGASDASTRMARQCVATDVAFGLTSVPVHRRSVRVVDVDLASASASEPEAEVVPAAAVGIPIQEAMLDVAGLRSRTDRDAALETLRALHAAECPHCTTATAHTNLVFGEGSSEALLMFVGEAPGEVEDQLGRPFVGPAGQKLDEMIKAIGFQRSDVYIANVLKSRPPGNRTPLQHEVDACGRYLVEQIRIIAPRVIVTLGGPATKLLLGTELGITRLRGIWARFVRPGIALDVMPTFHPAYLLRNYTAETRRQVWSDLQSALTRVREQA